MKKQLSLLAVAALLLSGCQYFAQKPVQRIAVDNENQARAIVTVVDQKKDLSAPDTSNETSPQYSIYLIALDDKGLNGQEVGCGDSVVPFVKNSTKSTSTNSELLTEAFNNLLGLKDKTLPQSAYSNFLSDSKLKLVSAEIKNGTAIIKLSGQLSLAGECDNPRVKAQLEETARQFDEVKSVEIFINDTTLEQATSLKG